MTPVALGRKPVYERVPDRGRGAVTATRWRCSQRIRGSRAAAAPRPGERCELCAEPIADEHGHLVDLEQPQPACAPAAAATCSSRPTGAGGGHFRAVPDRYLAFPDLRAVARAVGRAADPGERRVLLRELDARPGRRVLPEPGRGDRVAAAARHVGRARRRQPRLATLEPDVEAFLVRADRTASRRPSASSCRSTPATSSSASCDGCGAASTAASEAHDALDAFFADVPGERRR